MEWTNIQAFFALLTAAFGYAAEDLSLVAEVRTGGPTAQPGPANKNQIDSLVTAGPGKYLPSNWYDTLGSKHIEYRIIHTVKKGNISIPRVLYSWQHHWFPGNCGICVHRWIRALDDTNKWPTYLNHAALLLRVQLASAHGTRVLVISTGSSFHSAEPVEMFEQVYKEPGHASTTIRVMKMSEALALGSTLRKLATPPSTKTEKAPPIKKAAMPKKAIFKKAKPAPKKLKAKTA